MRKFHRAKSDKVQARIKNDLSDIPNCKLKQDYMAYYETNIPYYQENNGYAYHIDTKPQLKEDKDKEEDKEENKDKSAAAIAEVSKIYESEIGVITPIVRDKIIDALDNYPVEWIVEAVKEAVRSNVRNWAYVSAILQSWKERGFKAKKDLEPNANRIDDFRKLFAEQKKKMNGEKS